MIRHPVPTKIKLLHPPVYPPKRVEWVSRKEWYGTVHTASNIPKESASRVEIVEREPNPEVWLCSGTIQAEATDGPWARQETSNSLAAMKRWMHRNLVEMGLLADNK